MRNSLINRALVAKTKIFNYALLAAALLVGVNVNAGTVTTAADLQAALNAAQNNDVVLFAPADADDAIYGQTIKFYNPGKTVILDLNGTTYTTTHADAAFAVYGGTLKVQNGTIQSNISTANKAVYGFKVYGFDKPQDGKISKLIVEKDVFVNMPFAGAAVCVDTRNAATDVASELVSTNIFNGHGVAENVFVEIYGHLKGGKYGAQVTGNVRYPEKSMEYVTKLTDGNEYKTSIQTDDAKWISNVPKITIYPSAVVEGGLEFDSSHKGIGAYAAGYAEWTISGTIFGATGVLVKDGIVTLKDANIYSIWTDPYVAPVGQNSGSGAAGSGVVIESSSSYAGVTKVTVEGDTKITGTQGYGIEQAITNGTTYQLDQLNIKGGEIVGGEEGTVVIESANTDKVVITAGTSDGSTWTVNDTETGNKSEAAITDFIPKDNEGKAVSHKVEILDADGNVATTVIVPGPAPTKITGEECGTFNLNDLAENAGIDFGDCSTPQTLSKDLVLGEIIMNSKDNAQTITIPDGMKLTVKYLIMGGKSNITVEAGGTLIVSGNLGVKNVSTENITIEAKEQNMGRFFFAPEVVSNKHPKATVQLISRGYMVSADKNIWQRFGTPLNSNIQVQDMTSMETPKIGNAVFGWNYAANDWKQLAKTDILTPFTGYTQTTNAHEGGHKFAMAGELVGNADGELSFLADWNYFANSYTADIDLKQLLKPLQNSSIHATVWIYKPTENENLWDVVSLADVVLGDAVVSTLKPMQAFIIKSFAVAEHAIDYAKCVWNPVMNPSANSAPRAMAQSLNSVTISLANENGNVDKVKVRESADFSAEYENGYDVEKMMQGDVNLYMVSKMGNLCQIATDNVEGQTIMLATKNAANFTLSFSNVRGEKMALVDNMTGDVIEMAEGVTYNFMANANEVSERFTVVAAAQAPTALKKAEASAKAVKFINNGQVILQNNGRMFNVLGIEVK